MNAITQLIDAGYHAIAALDKEINRTGAGAVRGTKRMYAAQKRLHAALTDFLDDIFLPVISAEIELAANDVAVDLDDDAQDDADAHNLIDTLHLY